MAGPHQLDRRRRCPRRDGGGSGKRAGAASVRSIPSWPGSRPHDVAPPATASGTWRRSASWLARPENGLDAARRARSGPGAARRHRRPRRSAVDHRRRAQRDRPGRSEDAPSSPFPASGRIRLREPEHAVFDRRGILWFTGQSGPYGRPDPRTGRMRVFPAPRGEAPHGITVTPSGVVYYASLAGSYLGRIDPARATVRVLQPPTRGQARGARGPTRRDGSG